MYATNHLALTLKQTQQDDSYIDRVVHNANEKKLRTARIIGPFGVVVADA